MSTHELTTERGASQLMLCREIIDICWKSFRKCKYTVCKKCEVSLCCNKW